MVKGIATWGTVLTVKMSLDHPSLISFLPWALCLMIIWLMMVIMYSAAILAQSARGALVWNRLTSSTALTFTTGSISYALKQCGALGFWHFMPWELFLSLRAAAMVTAVLLRMLRYGVSALRHTLVRLAIFTLYQCLSRTAPAACNYKCATAACACLVGMARLPMRRMLA